MTLRKRIQILVNELSKRGKSISIAEICYLKVDNNKWERVGSTYELYERLMKEWEAN